MLQQCRAVGAPVSLANELPFWLGGLEVRPATRQVVRNGVAETLEPRVMQVLVVLGTANDAVVSRDELIDRCWDGRIVGDDAINRVISRVRRLSATFGSSCFELETITKVGYRLTAGPCLRSVTSLPGSPMPAALIASQADRGSTRRHLVGFTLAAGLGLAAFGSFRALTGPSYNAASARLLINKGHEALSQASYAQTVQAVAYFKEATTLDPTSAEAWGALALGHARMLRQASDETSLTTAQWARSTAKRALSLDPNDGNAHAALILSRPNFGNWAAVEADCRAAIDADRSNRVLQTALANLLCDVGRMRDAAEIHDQHLAEDRFEPFSQVLYAWALWSLGDLDRAQRTIEAAHRLWPTLESIWSARLCFLAMTGRPDAALAFANDPSLRPLATAEAGPPRYQISVTATRALQSGNGAEVDAAVAAILAARAKREVGMPYATMWLSVLGAVDTAFALLQRYYLERPAGGWTAEQILLRWRPTLFLFVPPVAPLRADRRFAALTEAIGLEAYWRSTRTTPDYRR